MVNFRAPTESLDLYDHAADAAGMSRSQWLRNAAELALASHVDAGFTPKAVPVEEGGSPKCVEGDFKTCGAANWTHEATGLNHCETCGIRTSYKV